MAPASLGNQVLYGHLHPPKKKIHFHCFLTHFGQISDGREGPSHKSLQRKLYSLAKTQSPCLETAATVTEINSRALPCFAEATLFPMGSIGSLAFSILSNIPQGLGPVKNSETCQESNSK